jgi:hypothetical protein
VSFTEFQMSFTLTSSYSWISNSNTAYWTCMVFKLANALAASSFVTEVYSLPSFLSPDNTFTMTITGNNTAIVEHTQSATTDLRYVPDNSIFQGPQGTIYSIVFLFTFYP